jgi:hypothetical protein
LSGLQPRHHPNFACILIRRSAGFATEFTPFIRHLLTNCFHFGFHGVKIIFAAPENYKDIVAVFGTPHHLVSQAEIA